MATMINNETPRIVCTKCVRIVKVHFLQPAASTDGYFIATECCQRLFGVVNGEAIQAMRYRPRDLTTSDITPIKDADDYAKEQDDLAKRFRDRAEWARWAK